MSTVKARKRKESYVQFIDTARRLYEHTLKTAKKFPKSLMFFITRDIVEEAKQVYTLVLQANSIYPNKAEAIKMREELLIKARSHLTSLDGLLSTTNTLKLITLSNYAWELWGELIYKEKKLIDGVLKADKQRI